MKKTCKLEMQVVSLTGFVKKYFAKAVLKATVVAEGSDSAFRTMVGTLTLSGKVDSISPAKGKKFPFWVTYIVNRYIGQMAFENKTYVMNGPDVVGDFQSSAVDVTYSGKISEDWQSINNVVVGLTAKAQPYAYLVGSARLEGFGDITGDLVPPEPPEPMPDSLNHLVGIGMFLGVMPWRTDGVTNDAPKDMTTLIAQLSANGGNLIQVQLLYEEGALFDKGSGLKLNSSKVAYCKRFAETCWSRGVYVTYVLFDHCSLKYENKWAASPLNSRNGGPFGGCFDIYSNAQAVTPYVLEVVKALNADNVIFEIINEGDNGGFAGKMRDALKGAGIQRITTSGGNPGGLWRYSEHGKTTAGAVKSGQLPNTDGQRWEIGNVKPICTAVRATEGSGLVFDGVTDAGHNWAEFLAAIRPAANPPGGQWGDLMTAPASDLSSEWTDGSNPALRVICYNGDKFMGSWVLKAITREGLPNGDVRMTMRAVQGPSGAWYKPYAWRIATEGSALILADSVVIPKGSLGGVTRARFECRRRTDLPPPANPNKPPIEVVNGKPFLSGEDLSGYGSHPYPPSNERKKALPHEVEGSIDLCAPESATRYQLRGKLAEMGWETVGTETGCVQVNCSDGVHTKWYVQ